MRAFPGMTPDDIWSLPFVEWLIVGTAADEWVAEQQKQQRKRR